MFGRGKYTSFIILFALFSYMLLINFYTPLMADDYRYAQNWEQTRHLESWSDIVDFQVVHYLEWGGRSVAHSFAQAMLFLGKPVFNVLNSLVFILLIVCIYYHARGQVTKDFEPMFLLVVMFLTWFCIPTLGETSIWLTGSCNYLWMTTLVLVFLLPYRLAVVKNFSQNKLMTDFLPTVMFIFGVLAGWTNENTGLMLIGALVLANLYCWQQRCLKNWMLFGLLGAVFGYGCLVFAPGNYVRIEEATAEDYSFVQNHIIDPMKTISTLTLKQLPIYLLLMYLVRRIFQYKKQFLNSGKWLAWKEENAEILWSSCCYIGLSFLALLVMCAAPTFPQRAGMGAMVFLLIGTLNLWRLNIYAECISVKNKKIFAILMVGLWSIVAIWAGNGYHTLYVENQARLANIIEAKANGVQDMRVQAFSVENRSAFGIVVVNDVGEELYKFRSVYYAKYFGFATMARQ